jgi:hypothetical protein
MKTKKASNRGLSGFNRKLGFRPVKPELLKATAERRTKDGERSTVIERRAQTLRRLAAGHLLFDLAGR